MLDYKPDMGKRATKKFEKQLTELFIDHKEQTEKELTLRVGGVKNTGGSSGLQFVGYRKLQQFYRGDQWDHDEPPGASQRTDNYCAVVVDTMSSLVFDAPPEVNCPSQDNTDEILELKAETKEQLLMKVYDDNNANELVFPSMAKVASNFGDGFIKGPLLETNGSSNRKDWKIKFFNVDNPANIMPIFMDENNIELYGFIDAIYKTPMWVEKHMGDKLRERGIDVEKLKTTSTEIAGGYKPGTQIPTTSTYQKMLPIYEFWNDKVQATFIEDKLVDWKWHNWGFVPLRYCKNIYVPNYRWGKSDIEDAIEPQLSYNRVLNDLLNMLRQLSTITLTGKNLEGMEVLVHGLSKIFNLPEDGELQGLDRSGDPYASSNLSESRRKAILDVTGLSESLLASLGSSNVSGKALSLALQSVIRKLNPRIKRFETQLQGLNEDIFKLMEIYWPETKEIIMGDYTNKVSIISTLLRNIVDELNKLQSGVQSLTTTQRNVGIAQPKMEQKVMKRDLQDPLLGPQIARQPGILQQSMMQNPEGTAGTPGSNEQGLGPAPGNAPNGVSQEGAARAANQQASNGAPPQVTP